MTQKKYPFSLRKHAHDLEFRRNRAKNELFDLYDSDDEQKKARLQRLIDDLADILLTFPDNRGVIWLTGKEYGLAMESVNWAEANRSVAYIR